MVEEGGSKVVLHPLQAVRHYVLNAILVGDVHHGLHIGVVDVA